MHSSTQKKIVRVSLFLLLIVFTFFLVFKIDWGSPFFFHPDERNIASSVSQLNFKNFNPHFFAYGQLPIYTVYGLGVLNNIIHHSTNPQAVLFENAIILGRLLSVIFTLLVVLVTYKATKEIYDKSAATLTLFFSALSVAYLQFSHFSTFEMLLTFFSVFMFYIFICFLKKESYLYFALGSIMFGVLCSLKSSSLVIILIPLYVIVGHIVHNKKKRLPTTIKLISLFIFFGLLTYILTSPYNILDIDAFISSMKYESGVATGSLPVFYTGSFFNQIPLYFQYRFILPFLINPLMTLLTIPAIIYVAYESIKKRNMVLGLLIVSLLILFIPSAIIFAKWTRYIVPAVPFLYMTVAIFLFEIKKKFSNKQFYFVILVLIIVNFIFAFSFVKTVRLTQDSRIQALNFAQENINQNAKILSEIYDLGIVPFNNHYPFITLFNFYDLDNGDNLKNSELTTLLDNSDYIILPSQRIYKTRTLNRNRFPVGNNFYKNLFNNKTQFKLIYQTPCDIFCKLTYSGDPVFSVEETSNVFDRPILGIFTKQ